MTVFELEYQMLMFYMKHLWGSFRQSHVQQHTEMEVFYVGCSCSGQWHLKSLSLMQQVDTKGFLII